MPGAVRPDSYLAKLWGGYAAWMLPPEAIEEFKILYHKRFGEEVSDQEAAVMAEKLLDLFRAVYRKNIPPVSLAGGTHSLFREEQRPDLVSLLRER